MSTALVWFRRDLRHYDHAALAAALAAHENVHCAFVFDTQILDALASRADRRVTFIWDCVAELKEALEAAGGGLHVLHGTPRDEIPRLALELGAAAVYANRDYEPAAIARDADVARALRAEGILFRDCKDQVIFELDEVRTRAGDAFNVFTPYRKAWLARLEPRHYARQAAGDGAGRLVSARGAMPPLAGLGFTRVELPLPAGMSGGGRLWAAFRERLAAYARERDFPALPATSRLSAHLRFGTVSIRELVRHATSLRGEGARAWLSELIWREFYFAVLAARPDVVDHCFRREFDALEWEHDPAAWSAWCEGRTGYPIVDAAMRELAAQGTMHNRLRMVAASFLAKDLGIDWRRGERWFAAQLLDYDLAANNGGWQWSASTGCDAQPWFRIFNPVTQSRRFDPQGDYIRRWVPELASIPDSQVHAPWEMAPLEQQAAGCVIGRDYPAPVVRHDEARQRTLARYGAVRRRAG
ncbi:MAG TPA: deoxyribodipyrimidine photo-lyase [Steroidobacteraceae bacterium]|nr:deoxyribodipyrimidine photo-lyase [Steroidobacteraceae bacterium]